MPQRSAPKSIGFLLAQVCRLEHVRERELLEELGLYRGQHSMLRALWEQEGLTHTELAKRSHVRPSTITKTIQRMEKVGLVERKHDAEDQRVSRVYLAEAGRSVQGDVEQTWHRIEEETFADFTLEERVLLRRFFLQIRENLIRVTRRKRP